MIKNIYWPSCKVPVILLSFVRIFLYTFSKSNEVSNFMKIRPLGAELFYADRQKDRHEEANSRLSQFHESTQKYFLLPHLYVRVLYLSQNK